MRKLLAFIRKIIANAVCGFIPSKLYRNRVRNIICFGLINYFKAKKGDATHGKSHIKYTEDYIKRIDKNDVCDFIIEKYVRRLKRAV